MINGNQYDWESVEIVMPHGIVIGVQEVSYSDERPIEARYGRGSIPRGYGRKNYEASGSLTLDKDEADRLQKALGGSFYTKSTFTVVVSYANHDQATITDVLKDCHITKRDNSAKQGEENSGQTKLDIVILSPIEWNGKAAYKAGRDGAMGR
ncbi:MAG: hypothetical protein HPY84_02700 [Syntrophobacteraceae bacterium]|jgi:hypothetical protein|nr:hypothetical protein [Syntrophobacteraceae bacterium]